MSGEEINTQSIRLPMEKEFKEKLKLFLLVVQPAIFPDVPNLHVSAQLAYRYEDALLKTKETMPKEMSIYFNGDFVIIEKLLEAIQEVEGGVKIESPGVIPLPSPSPAAAPLMGFEAFKAGLLMCLHEYVYEEQDVQDLQRILNKIEPKWGQK